MGEVHQVHIDGGLVIRSDGTYSSEYSLPQIHARLADALVAMDFKRDVIFAFRRAHNFPAREAVSADTPGGYDSTTGRGGSMESDAGRVDRQPGRIRDVSARSADREGARLGVNLRFESAPRPALSPAREAPLADTPEATYRGECTCNCDNGALCDVHGEKPAGGSVSAVGGEGT